MAHGPLHLNWILSASLLVRSQTATKSSHYAKGCCYETRRSLGIEVSLLFTADKSSSRARCQQRLVIVQLDLVQLGPNTTNNLTSLDVPVECRSEGKSVFWIGAEGGDWMRQATFGVYRFYSSLQDNCRSASIFAFAGCVGCRPGNISSILIWHYLPVVPHKAVAEVSKIGKL